MLSCNLSFPDQNYDSETGKHYNYFRDYDPAIGRYIESDPIGLDGGTNTFGYVGGSPVTRIDPTGEAWAARGAFGVGRAIGGAINGAIGLALGVPLGVKLYELCNRECDPPKGTICFFIDRVPPSKPHYPIPGSHYHLYQVNQAPSGECFWNSLGASATAPPGAIPCPFTRNSPR